jgi:endonuclease/exonuclease/phosphatase family metal-dependent hydrolase
MDGPRRRWIRGSIAVVTLVASATLLTGSTTGSTAPTPLRILQFNLCNSGIAECYTGRSVHEAASVIRVNSPDVVTLNEICRDDVDELSQAMAAAHLSSAFKAAQDRRTGGDFKCRNGQPFGIGVLVRLPAASRGSTMYSGIYPTQDLSDPEERAFVCVRAIGSFTACTTHLASTSTPVALAQCHYLLTTTIPAARSREPTIVAGDFNLGHAGSADVRTCLPPGYVRVDDTGVQQVIATSEFTIGSTALMDMQGTTDHPGLLVTLTGAPAR